MTVEERFMEKVVPEPTTGCWLWTSGGTSEGYGHFSKDGKSQLAHRVAHEIFVGSIPPGLTVDHWCNTPSCVNPAHLRAMTVRDNVLRGNGPPASNARKTRCPRGHEYRYSDTKRQRICLICRREQCRRTRQRKRQAAPTGQPALAA